jgi:hypothetical protein
VAEISKKRPPYPCICCGFLTLTDPSLGSYEICEVCFWEDDPVQNEDPLFVGGANAVSLARARENYVHYCACQPSFSDRVRPPRIDEVPRFAAVQGIKAVLVGIVRAMVSGHIGTFEGCSAVAAVGYPLDEPELEEILSTFRGVASETDALPTSETRHLWSPEVLRIKDAEAAQYEHRVRSMVQNACQQLERYLTAELRS